MDFLDGCYGATPLCLEHSAVFEQIVMFVLEKYT